MTINSNDENLPYLPDLSGLKDDEKQHILNVLLRDESLRNRHLARFMQLRKEVAELEEKSQTKSSSICARCHTAFGFIFNTGDICPKCGAKVCKQCRLMYNVHDNGWLCQLCCKQMQLMSYSGEWIYSQRSNLRKDSVTASEFIRKSLSPRVSTRNSDGLISSSDTEAEEPKSSSGKLKSSPQKSNRMIVQTSIDEDKLKTLKQNTQKRPFQMISSQSNSHLIQNVGSSDDGDSLFDQSTNYTDRTSSSSIPMNTDRPRSIQQSAESLTALPAPINRYELNQLRKQDVDCASVTSSEWGAESEKNETIPRRQPSTASRKSKPPSRVNLAGSIHSLRENLHRITKPHRSTSRTSLDSEQTTRTDSSGPTTPKTADLRAPSDSHSNLTINNASTPLRQSSDTLLPNETKARTPSLADSLASTTKKPTKAEAFGGSVGQLDLVDSDDDIDQTFERVKSGSQLSINSVFSESKACYGLDISGSIELKLTYSMNTGALDILLNKCANLARAKRHLTSDPYVKVYLLPDRSKNSKRKTTIKKNTTDPVFEEKFRYHLTKQDFDSRVLWISVWSQATLGQNDFLGEIHIPLATCTLDRTEEHQLLGKKHKNDLLPNEQLSMEAGEILFQLTFLENPKNKDLGTLQVHHIEGKSIYYGKNNIDAICKGLLMPDNIKRKLPNVRKGPSPKWELPLRWEGVRRDNLKNTSIEISIWCQERFRKVMLGFVRLNLAQGYFDNKPVKWSDATNAEKLAWETFLKKPAQAHSVRLPLRPGLTEK